MAGMTRKPYPFGVSDDEWALVAPYLTLLPEGAGQRENPLREVFDRLRFVVRTGAPWRAMPHDLPPWHAVHDQARRWMRAGGFERLAYDLRALSRLAGEREPAPRAAILDSRTLRSTPESGHRAGYDGAKRKRGSKVHLAVDTLGHLLALHVTPANACDRAEVGRLAAAVQAATGESVELAYVGQGYTGERCPRPRGRARHPPAGGQAPPGQAQLRAPAPQMGGRARLRLGHPLPKARQGLRTPAHNPRRPPSRRLRLPHAQTRRSPGTGP